MNDKVRLIDANALLDKQTEAEGYGGWIAQVVLVEDIENAPEVDAVPVVRCGDCKYGTWLESCQRRRCDYWTCFRNGMVYGRANTVNENDYCSYGAKMEGGTP